MPLLPFIYYMWSINQCSSWFFEKVRTNNFGLLHYTVCQLFHRMHWEWIRKCKRGGEGESLSACLWWYMNQILTIVIKIRDLADLYYYDSSKKKKVQVQILLFFLYIINKLTYIPIWLYRIMYQILYYCINKISLL